MGVLYEVESVNESNQKHNKMRISNRDPEAGPYCPYTLRELQKIVGGLIQLLYLDTGELLVINEEGKFLDLPYNPLATAIARLGASIVEDDCVVGPALLCRKSQVR